MTKVNKVYFIAGNEGKTSLFEIDTDTEEVKCTIGGDRKIYGFSVSEDGSQIAICYNSSAMASQVSVFDVEEEKEVKVTCHNTKLFEGINISPQEEIKFKSVDGLEVNGYIIRALEFEEGKKYPTILQIHGGPNLAYGWSFNFEYQLLASLGYNVIFCNPRGSRGFGEEFTYKIKENYHKLAYEDIMAFTDKCIELGCVDEDKMGVTGPSYGGFMTNWIISQTNRFKAAVPQASICNWISMFGLSDFGYMIHELLLIDPIDDLMDLWEMSPLAYAKNVETPALILHGESDMRCPLDQAEQWFVRLKSLGKEVEMITFPKSNHMMMRNGKPSFRIIRMEEIAKYFDKYLKK